MHDDIIDATNLRYPLFVKPARADGSFEIGEWSYANDDKALFRAIELVNAKVPERPLLIQEFLPGEEYTLGIIGNPEHHLTVLPVLEVDYSNLPGKLPIQCHESKWNPLSAPWTKTRYREAKIGNSKLQAMKEASIKLFRALGCRDYARFDFRTASSGEIKLLEVNPNSSWCWDGKMAIMADIAGIELFASVGANFSLRLETMQ